jgi:Archaeal holliday junction resolvase (hjc)
MPSGYRNGADLERAVKHDLEDNGYSMVMKSGGSKGKVDVIALKPGEVLLVQCKVSGSMSPADRIALRSLAYDLGAVPLMARWVKDGSAARTIGYTEITSRAPAGHRPWTPDRALARALAHAAAPETRQS